MKDDGGHTEHSWRAMICCCLPFFTSSVTFIIILFLMQVYNYLMSLKTHELYRCGAPRRRELGMLSPPQISRASSGLDQMRAIRKSDQPGAAVDTQFLTDPRGMVLDGPNGQPEHCGDFLIGKALSNELEDLHLARSQTLVLYTLQHPFGDQSRPLSHVRMDDVGCGEMILGPVEADREDAVDRKSTRLNSSHHSISYAVFFLKKKKDSERWGGIWLRVGVLMFGIRWGFSW